jgi:hypothetical protein
VQVRLFEYTVILQPKEDKDGEEIEPGKLIVDPATILAKDPDQAGMIAARAIPDEYMDRLDRLSVVVRPF